MSLFIILKEETFLKDASFDQIIIKIQNIVKKVLSGDSCMDLNSSENSWGNSDGDKASSG